MKKTQTYAILGGTSGIGFALAQRLVARGDRVAIGGRSAEKRAIALRLLGERASAYAVDTTDRASLAAFFAQTSALAGLFTPAASYTTGAFQEGSIETSEALFQAKFWGQYWAVYAALPSLLPDAAVVLMSGAASARPLGAPAYAACNAALEGLARGLAVELAPRRVNCLSPGTTDSTLWQGRPAQVREAAYQQWGKLNVLQRPATVEEQADAALFLLDNTHMTGNTLYCDGGYTLR
ncbi:MULTISPECIES: SDR family oxidoreductase [unclassified Symbiopectobacterium]|uniref:SDR family oxidoreductase n=2 Tax=Symbiopectobacterium TaxID=801 RepID=UPI002226174E|nr:MULTISPECIES: SDR family oxidoreductase [unclassified Symbiopectobacterium]MCW2476167.1 SDR family oxidoreductase [Candidatus Symbiopectobacterium sp. NZEC151]MCW2487173.1 SDR family oxidoreductase [Candidatus Symbiopectobacterium sp. NZEC127]